MSQHVVRVTVLVDTKDAHAADARVYRVMQDACHDDMILNWMFSDIQNGLAAMRVSPPIRKSRSGSNTEERIIEEYDRLLAIRALTKEQTDG